VLVRIRLAQLLGKPGRPTNHRTPSGAVVMTNEAATDGHRGPPRPTRSTFCWHKQQKVERMKIRPGRAPRRGRGRRRGRAALQQVRRLLFSAAGGRTHRPWGGIGPDTLPKCPPTSRRAPVRPPSSPAPAPTARPPTRRRSPAAHVRRGVGRVMPPSRRKSRPTPLVRRELGPRARAGVSRRQRAVAVSRSPRDHGTVGRWRPCARGAGRSVSRAVRS
jgi:hypothetical protein